MTHSRSVPGDTITLRTPVCEVGIDPSVGNLPLLAFHTGGRTLEPLHRAHWVDDDSFPEAMQPVDRKLSGDFVCVPFGKSDVEPSPPHGWSANSPWFAEQNDGSSISMVLERRIMGARLRKHVRPAPDAPLLYQVHTLDGGSGGITFAHHPMVRVSGGARLFTSPKRLAITLDVPIVQGHHALACGAVCDDLTAIPGRQGGMVDVSRVPISSGDEDFVALVEAKGSPLGWTAVIRDGFDDIVFFLKDPAVLPLTMLWHSNGGRLDAPWSGRHRDVLGIEDGIAAGGAGHKAALEENVFSRAGVPTALPLAEGRSHRIPHVIGAIPRPAGWQVIADIALTDDRLEIKEAGGQSVALPFDASFFQQDDQGAAVP